MKSRKIFEIVEKSASPKSEENKKLKVFPTGENKEGSSTAKQKEPTFSITRKFGERNAKERSKRKKVKLCLCANCCVGVR